MNRAHLILKIPAAARHEFLVNVLEPKIEALVAEGFLTAWQFHGDSLPGIENEKGWSQDLIAFDAPEAESTALELKMRQVLNPEIAERGGSWQELPPILRTADLYKTYSERRYGGEQGLRVFEDFSLLGSRFALRTLDISAGFENSTRENALLRTGFASVIFLMDVFDISPETRGRLEPWISFITTGLYSTDDIQSLLGRAAALYQSSELLRTYLSDLSSGNYGRFEKLFTECRAPLTEISRRFHENQRTRAHLEPYPTDVIAFANFIHAHSFRIGLSNDREALLLAVIQNHYQRLT